jgi:hypothetical protein
MAIMPTRSFPPGAISEAGDVCPNAVLDTASNPAINRRSLTHVRLSRRDKRVQLYQPTIEIA